MSDGLNGKRVLLVEDESLVAMLLETILEDVGCIPVGPAPSVAAALDLVTTEAIDAAILDVNVAGQTVFPVADALSDRGVPFIFSTGYGEGGLPEHWRSHPTVQKPFIEDAIRQALSKALGVATA